MDILVLTPISKVVSAICIFGFSILFGIAPLFCKVCVRSKKVQWINNSIICFSGGTLLGISFLHLMPETRSSVARLRSEGHFTSFPVHISLADTIICVGFFVTCVLDELIHLLLQYAGSDHHHHQPHGKRETDLEAFHFIKEGPKTKEVSETKDKATSADEENVEPTLQHSHSHSGINIHIPSILTIMALSFHDVFEGLALGIQKHVDDVLFMFLSIATHKYAIAFSVSLDLLLSGVRDNMIFLYTILFSIVNPVGICIGIASGAVSSEGGIQSPVTVFMQGLASGSLIYVTCVEVLQRHKTSEDHISGLRNTLFLILGFIFILIMKIYLPHDHSFHEYKGHV